MRCFCDQREQKYWGGASRAPNRIFCVIGCNKINFKLLDNIHLTGKFFLYYT